MKGPIKRPPRIYRLTAAQKWLDEPDWRHQVETWLQFAIPGDRLELPDAESVDHARFYAKRHGKAGVEIVDVSRPARAQDAEAHD